MSLDTPLGRLRVWATSDHHLGFATATPGYDEDADAAVTINRVSYTLRFDVTKKKAADRKYHDRVLPFADTDDDPDADAWVYAYDSILLRRTAHVATYNAGLPSSAARDKALSTMAVIAAELIESDLGRELLSLAGHSDREKKIAALTHRIAELDKARAELVAELAGLDS